MKNVLLRLFHLSALPAMLVATWWVVGERSGSFFVPSPVSIAGTLREEWLSERLVDDVLPSLWRLGAGLALAIAGGIGLGVLLGSVRRLRAVTEPVLEFLRAIPPPVLVPILLLLFGVGDRAKVLVIVSGCIWPVLLNTIEGVRAIDPVVENTCRSYRIAGSLRLRAIVLRSASPQLMTGVRQALPIGIILMVIGEMFASSNGLGFTIVQFQHGFEVPQMWSGTVVLGLLGLVLAVLYRLVERRTLAWYHGQREVRDAGG